MSRAPVDVVEYDVPRAPRRAHAAAPSAPMHAGRGELLGRRACAAPTRHRHGYTLKTFQKLPVRRSPVRCRLAPASDHVRDFSLLVDVVQISER